MPAPLDKGRKLLQLLHADRCLEIRRLQVVSEMTVHIFVVITVGQLPVIAVKTPATQVVTSGRADTVAAPVAVRQDQAVKQGVIRVDTSALAHCHMVGRVK